MMINLTNAEHDALRSAAAELLAGELDGWTGDACDALESAHAKLSRATRRPRPSLSSRVRSVDDSQSIV